MEKYTRYISCEEYSHDDLVKLMKSGNVGGPDLYLIMHEQDLKMKFIKMFLGEILKNRIITRTCFEKQSLSKEFLEKHLDLLGDEEFCNAMSGNTSILYSVRRDIKKLLQSKKA